MMVDIKYETMEPKFRKEMDALDRLKNLGLVQETEYDYAKSLLERKMAEA